jgi:hypothetical protein
VKLSTKNYTMPNNLFLDTSGLLQVLNLNQEILPMPGKYDNAFPNAQKVQIPNLPEKKP